MKCLICGYENPEDVTHCERCDEPVVHKHPPHIAARRKKMLVGVIAIAITVLLISVLAYSMGWFTETSSAKITCYIYHHEGGENVTYHIYQGYGIMEPTFWEVGGVLQPGETAEVVMTHTWRGTGPSSQSIEYRFHCRISGTFKQYVDGVEFQVIPGGDYRTECHIYLNDNQTDAIFSLEDSIITYPVSGEPLTPPYSTNLTLDIRNGYADDWNHFIVFIDGVGRIGGFLGPQSSRNVTIPVSWESIYQDSIIHYSSIEVYSGNPYSLTLAELVAMGDGADVSISIVI